jgi:AraC-like DNA-binding protein
MALRNISISNTYVRAVVKHSAKAGLSPEDLLRSAGISPGLLDQPNARLPVSQFARLSTMTMLALNDEFLGYGKSAYLPGTWINMCHATLHTNSVAHTLARYCRFFQMFDADIRPFFKAEGEQLKVVFEASDPDYPYEIYAWEQQLFNLHRYLSWRARQHLPLLAVTLSYPEPEFSEEYRRMFLGYPVLFEQPENALVFSAKVGELPVNKSELSLQRMLRHPNLVLLAQQYRQRSYTALVKQQLNRNLQTIPSLDQIAFSLKLHPQTLRRRLASEGTSYNEIKAQCRRDTALYYLGRSNLSIEQIALKAGFSETSAFTRAFKGWTGVAPQTYRNRN